VFELGWHWPCLILDRSGAADDGMQENARSAAAVIEIGSWMLAWLDCFAVVATL